MRKSFIDSWHSLQDTCLRTVIVVFYSPNVLGGHSPWSALFWSSGHLLGGLPATQRDLGMDAKATWGRGLLEEANLGPVGPVWAFHSSHCLHLSNELHIKCFSNCRAIWYSLKKKSTFHPLMLTSDPHTSEMRCGFIYPLCFFVKHNTYKRNWKPSWFLL